MKTTGGKQMVNLNEQFGRELQLMREVAEGNIQEATEMQQQAKEELEESKGIYNALIDRIKVAKAKFRDYCKILRKLTTAKAPDPEEMATTLEPFNDYVDAKRGVPGTREDVEEKKDDLARITRVLHQTRNEAAAIEFLQQSQNLAEEEC